MAFILPWFSCVGAHEYLHKLDRCALVALRNSLQILHISARLMAHQVLGYIRKNCSGHRVVKSISLQILQRDLKQLPHHYACSVRRCRKPSIFITINPSSCDSLCGTFHAVRLCVMTNRSELVPTTWRCE
jgi:hypothetical protein